MGEGEKALADFIQVAKGVTGLLPHHETLEKAGPHCLTNKENKA